MSRSKPIWCKVRSCKYQSDKSYGAYEDTLTEIYTGSSASNSSLLGSVEVTKKLYNDASLVVFNLYLDGVLMKQNVHIMTNRTTGSAGRLLMQISNETRGLVFLNSKNLPFHPIMDVLDEYIQELKHKNS